MTTLHAHERSPRLPANHPLMVEEVLAREAAWRAQRKKNRFYRALVAATAISIAVLVTVFILTWKH